MAPVPEGDHNGPNRNESQISDLNTPPVNLEVDSGSSSSEEDDSPYSGYQLLAQDPDTTEADDTSSAGTDALPDLESDIQGGLELQGQRQAYSGLVENLPPAPNCAAEERRAVWNKPAASHGSHPTMDAEQVQQIKTAMANFKLPTPDWAKAIPEDRWKEQLFQRLSPGGSTVQGSVSVNSQPSKCQGSSQQSEETKNSGQGESESVEGLSVQEATICDKTQDTGKDNT